MGDCGRSGRGGAVTESNAIGWRNKGTSIVVVDMRDVGVFDPYDVFDP